jgi:hypothetical protein
MAEKIPREQRRGYALESSDKYDTRERYASGMSETVDGLIDREAIPNLDYPKDGTTKQVVLRENTKPRRARVMESTLSVGLNVITDPVMLRRTEREDGGVVEYALSHPENPEYPEYRWTSDGSEAMTTLPEGVDYETAVANPVEISDDEPRSFRPLDLDEMRVTDAMLMMLNGSHVSERSRVTRLRAKVSKGMSSLLIRKKTS